MANAQRYASAAAQQQQQRGGIDPRNRQAQQAHDYQDARNEAHSILEGDESPTSSGDEQVAESLRVRNHSGGEQRYQQEQQHQEHYEEGEDMMMDDEDHGDDSLDDQGSFSDSLSSSPSIPDEDIDFTLVYALHTFLATVDGQASVVKGDKLLLLDDSNSYWWLVRVLKTQAVGYIPAENIETPWERLARLNKHRNVDLTSATQQDVVTGPLSTVAQTRFEGRIPPSQQPHPHQSQHPSAKGVLASPSHKDHPRNISPNSDRAERSHSSKAKTVIFTAPTYYEHSANGEETEDEYDDEEMDEHGEMIGDQVFDDDGEEDEESEFSDDNLTEEGPHHQGEEVHEGGSARSGVNVQQHSLHHETQGQVGTVQDVHDEGVDGGDEDDPKEREEQTRWDDPETAARIERQKELEAQWYREHEQAQRSVEQADATRATSPPRQQLGPQLSRQQQQEQQQEQQREQQRAQSAGGQYRSPQGTEGSVSQHERRVSDPFAAGRRPSDGSVKGREINESDFEPDAPTKKLTATPPIVRDPNFDINNPYADLPGGVPRASSPMRVRGVEVIDPKDPRYNRLITAAKRPSEDAAFEQQRRPSNDYANDADTSLNSMETASSYASGASGLSGVSGVSTSDDGHRTATPASSNSAASSKKLKKNGRESMDGEGEKKRKSGGILGLFRKKDKKKKDDGSVDLRSSEESARVVSPVLGRRPGSLVGDTTSPRTSSEQRLAGSSNRESQTAESMFSTDAALRQQQVEAKQAMYHQYGVQRAPGDVTNTMTPRAGGPRQQALSPTTGGLHSPSLQPPQRMRPGSLIGSPSIPGLDVPLLSVLRVFAGDNVEAEATFKTVLLNQSTTSSDLVKQSMQRFRLVGMEDRDEYYLSVKELGGEERPLDDEEKPLVLFETLAEQAESNFTVPNVRRSSVGSINSISSNLSLNPAITRLGMNDWSDDSAVKFYLNRRVGEANVTGASSDIESISTANGISASTPLNGAGGLQIESNQAVAPSPGFRFAVRILIHPADLPDNVAFDSQSQAIIPKSVLLERQQRNGGGDDADPISPHARDKIIFFPRNVNVSEVIEAGLDRFGIVDGVVDGGDEVEDRVSRRRSVSRVKYGLAVERDGHETLLSASGKLLDSYSSPPLFKPYDRTSKEFRRRSVDATLILGGAQDVQPSDPVFIIRRAAYRGPASRGTGPIPSTIDELEERQQAVSSGNIEDEEILARAASPKATRQEIIAAQRVVSRANQRAILSAHKNQEQGIDISIPDHGTIRSTRDTADDRVRYSFVTHEGKTTDISDIVENEWATSAETPQSITPRSTSRSSRATDADSFRTAPDSLYASDGPRSASLAGTDDEDEEERRAVAALRSTDVDIDAGDSRQRLTSKASSSSLRKTGSTSGDDVLQDALGPRPVTSPLFNESLQDRLDRVLAKVKDDKAKGRASPGARPRSFQLQQQAAALALASGGQIPASSRAISPNGRRSPYTTGRDSPSIDQIIGGGGSRSSLLASGERRHGKKPSIASMSSTRSSNTDQPSTPITGGSSSLAHGSTLTPISSSGSRHSNPAPAPRRIVYREDFGLDTLVAIVDADSHPRPSSSASKPRDVGADSLFGPSPADWDVHPDVKTWYDAPTKRFDDLESRLDALLLQFSSPRLVQS